MRPIVLPLLLACLMPCVASMPARAQAPSPQDSETGTSVVPNPNENVRLDYAQVLNVEPVYQTLRASRTEMVCDEPEQQDETDKKPQAEPGRMARMWNSVKGIFGNDEPTAAAPLAPAAAEPRCRAVPVDREFRRPIAYDVDYMYKGMKYRSRMAEDPGKRLRIRISVVPYNSHVQEDAVASP
ncbi:hypothetical protein CSC70_07135 [Pseudoxanthomonas kalamensis DSM 18571]|uniref:hypothetical protein n=1 Tax=Pseudoxanthomonas kalamensis TaxID=289483 RepID=UPI00139082AB|nr:hypothetical protein [Pseudoxanthomonas kalamensis]KAF1710440.1 hypothetical protein CSC70_07135 [Pseudoxanthomonas kalamensis DSM 18571]